MGKIFKTKTIRLTTFSSTSSENWVANNLNSSQTQTQLIIVTDNCSCTYLCKPRNQAYICHIWVNQLLVDMCKSPHLISFDGKIYLDGHIFLLIEFQQFFRCCRSVASSNSHCCTEIQILFLKPIHFTYTVFPHTVSALE